MTTLYAFLSNRPQEAAWHCTRTNRIFSDSRSAAQTSPLNALATAEGPWLCEIEYQENPVVINDHEYQNWRCTTATDVAHLLEQFAKTAADMALQHEGAESFAKLAELAAGEAWHASEPHKRANLAKIAATMYVGKADFAAEIEKTFNKILLGE